MPCACFSGMHGWFNIVWELQGVTQAFYPIKNKCISSLRYVCVFHVVVCPKNLEPCSDKNFLCWGEDVFRKIN